MNESERNILCCVATLICVGIVMIYSVSSARAVNPNAAFETLGRQLMWMVIGTGAMLLAWRLDYRKLEAVHIHILIVAIVLLVLVLIPGIGTLRNGARRWIRFGSYFGIQPSEFAKIALCIFLAGFASQRQERVHMFLEGFVPMMLAIGTMAGLILIEPDFGTAALVGCAGAMIALAAGVRTIYVVATLAVSAPAMFLLLMHSPHRWQRILAFLDPWEHASSTGYQVIQSLIALGSGGLWGRGLGASLQKLYFLPEPQTDFIFAVLGEEMGALGTVGVLCLFAVLVCEGLRVANRASHPFAAMLAFGLTMMVGLQACINVAVVTGSVPTKGLALPFISAGGSSLVFSMMGMGILLQIARRSPQPADEKGSQAALPPPPRSEEQMYIPSPEDLR